MRLVSAVVAVFLATSAPARAEESELELFQQGVAAIRDGDWTAFLAACERLESHHRGSTAPAASALRGIRLYSLGQQPRAFEELWRGRPLDDEFVAVATRYAAFKSGHYAEARVTALEIPDEASEVRDEWLLLIDGPYRRQTPLAGAVCEGFTKGRRARVITDIGVDRRRLEAQLEETAERSRAAKVTKLRREHRALSEVTDLVDKVFRAFDKLCEAEPDSHAVPSVYVLASRQEFDDFNLRLGNHRTHSAVGFHYADYDVIVAYESEPVHAGPHACSPALRKTLVHEAFHQWLGTYATNAPRWFNEGLAEYFEEGRLTTNGLEAGGVDEGHQTLIRREIERCLPLADLVQLDTAGFYDPSRVHLNYAQAWSFVHFLASDRPGQRILRAYFHALREGAGAEGAYRAAFGAVDMTKLEERWRAYALRG